MVKNQRLRKALVCFFSLCLLFCSLASSASAVTFISDGSYTELINVGRFAVCSVLDEYIVPYAYQVIDDDGSTDSIDYDWYDSDIGSSVSVSWYCGSPSVKNAAYVASQVVEAPGGNWQLLSFSNTQPFILTSGEWSLLMDYFTVIVPDSCDFTFSVSFSGYYPVLQKDGGYRWTKIQGSESVDYDYENYGSGTYRPLNFLGNLVNDHSFESVFSKGIYCTELTFTVELYSSSSSMGCISYTMPYVDSVNTIKPLDYFRQFPKENTVITQVESLNASTIGAFLATATGGFFEAEVIPGLSLGGILAAVVGVIILIAFLKMR